MRTRILQHILAALAVLTVIAAQAADTLKDTYQILSGGVLRQFDVATDELQRTRPTGEQWTMQIPAQPNAEAVRQHAEQLQATLGDQVELVLYEKGSPRNEFTRRVSTKKVFVRLARGTNAQALAQSLGAVSLGELSYAPGCYIFQVNQPGAMLTLAERLQTQPGVEFVEPLLAARTILHYTPNDTYFGNQWHLRNTGQNGGTPGVDVAVSSVWDLYDGTGTKMHGNGITIGILDTGVQIAHPDLAPNVDLALSWDYVDGNNDPSPNPTWSGAGHGTCVAGLSAARGDNNLGVCGVAYESRLAGLRLPIGVYTDPDSVAAAFARGNNLIQVKNNSWGYIPFYAASAPETNALANGVLTGRGGLGTIYVFAAGNGAQNGWDANSHTLANSRFVIQVGAVNDRGDKTFYSEPGASLLVAAPGSDYYIAPIGITTTDMLGNNGYNYSGTLGDLSDVDYTQLFNGTSAAAPIVSGVIALMLQANPSLTWRDVQEILIRSATMNSPSDPDWVANSAGFRFNHKFGAGLVNAERAVSLAQSWANLGPETNVFIAQSGLTLPIPDNNVAGVGIAFDFDTSYPTLRVEHVEVTVNITHPRRGDLVITLTSPGGMQSRLAELRTDNAANYNWTFMTTRHWGESSRGIWSLQVADRAAGQTGTVTACTVRIYGTGAGASTSPSLPAWGDNSVGQLATPTGVTNVVAISAGTTHSLALNADGKVVAWGNNAQFITNVPASLSGVTSVSAGNWHSMALKSDGTVAVWGNNRYGQLNVPAGVTNIIAIAAGDWHNLALRSNGTVVAWGDNRYGQLNVPANLSGVVSVAAGYYHNLALKDDGTVVGWGDNSCGQIRIPAGLSSVIAIAAGCWHSLALKSDGTVVAWGSNSDGQLNVPLGLSNVVGIAAGYSHSVALRSDGTVVTWGRDRPITGLTNIVAVTAGDFHNVALRPFGPTNITTDLLLPAGTVGASYIRVLQAAGGTPIYRWTLSSGKLPEGLDLSINGTISGTPVKPGLACFRVRVTGGNGFATEKDYCIIIRGGGISNTNHVMASSSGTFTWDPVFGASQYALWLGSSAGAYDIYAGAGSSRWRALSTLPLDGRTIFATLWALINGTWVQQDTSVFTAATAVPAAMLRPLDNSVLTDASTTFIWDTGLGVSQYALWIGNTAGSYDIYAGLENGQSRKLTLPSDGRTLHATLWSRINGAWQSRAYTYTASTAPAPQRAQMLSPPNGTTLTAAPTTFIWDTGVGATQYALWVGDAPMTWNLHASAQRTLSRRLTTLPTDGRTIHVTLWSWINGSWQPNAYSYICGGGPAPAPTPAAMLAPADGATLSGASTTFIWNAGSGVSAYALWVGNTPSSYDLYASVENGQSRTLTLPTDGRTIHVTLWSWINGAWQSNAYTYTAFTQPTANAAMLAPAPGSTLTGSATTFIWDTGVGVSGYALWVGSSPLSYDIYQGIQSGQSRTLTLPTDGRTIHVTLWSWINGSWQPNAYSYTASLQ